MGFFSSSSSPAAPKTTSDGGAIAPDRSERAQCYDGRDAFFKCLDQNNIIDSIKEDGKARANCANELLAFEKACKDSWVTYFKKRRVMEAQRDATIKRLNQEGAQGMSVTTDVGSGSATMTGK